MLFFSSLISYGFVVKTGHFGNLLKQTEIDGLSLGISTDNSKIVKDDELNYF